MSNSFKKNFSILTIGEFGSRAIGMLTNVILARYLAPEGYGQYTIVLTYTAILYAISCLGVNQLTIRYVARNQDNSLFYFRISLLFRFLGFILSAIGFTVYEFITKTPVSLYIVFIILASVFLENIWQAFQNVAFGMQRMEWNSIINVSSAALNLAIYFLLPSHLITVKVVLFVYLVVYLIKDFVYYICLNKSNLLRRAESGLMGEKVMALTFLQESFPFYILMVFGLLTNQLPTLFLGRNSSMEEVAFFGTANKLLLPLTIFMNTALTALFPNQSQLFVKDKEQFQRMTIKIITILTAIGVVLSVIISLFRWEIVELMYGESYVRTADVMAFQCWYFVLYSIFCANGATLGAANEQKTLALCSIIYGIISTPILYYASCYGAQGLSVGYIVASLINITYIFFVLMKILGSVLTINYIARYLVFFLLSFFTVAFIPPTIMLKYRILIFFLIILGIALLRKSLIAYVQNK